MVQCVKQQKAKGLYEIDTSVTTTKSGFILIDAQNADSSLIIEPPDLSGLVDFDVN